MSHKKAKTHQSTFWFEGDIKEIAEENLFFRRAVYWERNSLDCHNLAADSRARGLVERLGRRSECMPGRECRCPGGSGSYYKRTTIYFLHGKHPCSCKAIESSRLRLNTGIATSPIRFVIIRSPSERKGSC